MTLLIIFYLTHVIIFITYLISTFPHIIDNEMKKESIINYELRLLFLLIYSLLIAIFPLPILIKSIKKYIS